MKIFRSKILTRCINLVLILSLTNLFQGCSAYRIVKTNPKDEHRLSRFQSKGRYFILKNKDSLYHLSDLKIANGAIIGIISDISEEHGTNIFQAGEQPDKLDLERSAIIDSEIILYTQLEIPENSTTVTIALNSIDEVSFYKWQISKGAKVTLALCFCILPVLVIIVVATAGLNQDEAGGGISFP